MDEQSSNDHLGTSLTDLMTSLMVIFILLLLAFISHTAQKDAVLTDILLKQLQRKLHVDGIDSNHLKRDPRDRDAILVIVPGDLMEFDTQRSDLRQNGEIWLSNFVPQLASTLCDKAYAPSVDSIIVEGHTDSYGWAGKTIGASEEANLQLSQDRALAVVKASLHTLEDQPPARSCFLNKLAAVGRGQMDPEYTPQASRRVIFRIRVKAAAEKQIEKRM
jgi:outer membrane protein OmpA-like peptidoglycan-associated protein